MDCAFGDVFKKSFPNIKQKKKKGFYLRCLFRNFLYLVFEFRLMMNFELIFTYGVIYRSNFFLFSLFLLSHSPPSSSSFLHKGI